MSDISGVDYSCEIDLRVKTKFLEEELGKLKVEVDNFDINSSMSFIRLNHIVERINNIQNARIGVIRFVEMYKEMVENNRFPTNFAVLREFRNIP